MEYQSPIQTFVYNYKGKMYRLKTKWVDLLVTPNHKLLYCACDFRNPKPFTLKEARLLFGKAKRFKKDGVWKGKNEEYFALPAVKIKHGNKYYAGLRIKGETKWFSPLFHVYFPIKLKRLIHIALSSKDGANL